MTQTQHLEQRITEALVTIRREWPAMMPVGAPSKAPGGGAKSALITADDDADTGHDIDAMSRLVSARREVANELAVWCKTVIEDANVTAPPIRCDRVEREPATLTWPKRGPVPIEQTCRVCRCGRTTPLIDGHLHWLDGGDVPDMCTFLERWTKWLSGHAEAEDAADRIAGCASGCEARELVKSHSCDGLVHKVERHTPPPIADRAPLARRLIGRCTEQVERDDESIRPCAGRVFAYPEGDGIDVDGHDVDDPWATCERCGSRAVVSVWQRWMFPEVAQEMTDSRLRDRVLSGDEVLNLAHKEFGKPAKRAALWHWVSRGQLAPIDRDKKPHTFRLGDVVDFLAAKAG